MIDETNKMTNKNKEQIEREKTFEEIKKENGCGSLKLGAEPYATQRGLCDKHMCIILNEPCVGCYQEFSHEGGHPMYKTWYGSFLDADKIRACPMSYLNETQARDTKERRTRLMGKYEKTIETAKKQTELWEAESFLEELKLRKHPKKGYLTAQQELEVERLRQEAKRTKESELTTLANDIEIWKGENRVTQLRKELEETK